MNHNKRRNTAFLYEALVRELTKSVVAKDEERKSAVMAVKKHAEQLKTQQRRLLVMFEKSAKD